MDEGRLKTMLNTDGKIEEEETPALYARILANSQVGLSYIAKINQQIDYHLCVQETNPSLLLYSRVCRERKVKEKRRRCQERR